MPSQKVDRKIDICGKSRVVRHVWKKHDRGYSVKSTLLRAGSEQPTGKEMTAVVTELSLVEAAGKEHADQFCANVEKRSPATPAPSPSTTKRAAAAAAAAAASTPAKERIGADAALSQAAPLVTAIVSGTKRAARPGVEDRPRLPTVRSRVSSTRCRRCRS